MKDKGIDYNQPVAYDTKGRPLYLRPEDDTEKDKKPMSVHIVKSTEPNKQDISDIIKLKHERSKQLYPQLNLTEGEYVIRAVRRHLIGMFWPLLVGFLMITLLILLMVNFENISPSLTLNGVPIKADEAFPIFALMIYFTLAIIYVFYYVYTRNRFFLTNESVIQEIQYALFSKNVQTLSLINVEDASYMQANLLQQIFNYGTIKLSTIGEEHTYQFTYASKPREYIAILNNAVEAFKNGRPVDDSICEID